MKPDQTICCLLLIAGMAMALCTRVQAQQQPSKDSVTTAVTDSAKIMNGVTVSSKKEFIEQTAGKITLNMAVSPVAAGGNAYEALLRAPGMFEQQDNLQFRGKSVLVLINGRPSNLSGQELKAMLTATPAGGVEKVEIMTTPPARYDAQGDVVVNIKLVKNKSFGTNATLTGGAGWGHYGRYNGGLLANHRSKKVNAYASYDLLQNTLYNKTDLRRTMDAHTLIRESDFTAYKRLNHSYRAGVDYEIDKSSTAGVMARGMLLYRDRNSTNQVVKDNIDNGIDSSSRVFTGGRTIVNNISVNAYYTKQLTKGKELTVNADYFSYDKTWKDQVSTIYSDENGHAYQPEYLLRNNSPSSITIYAFSADYTHPLKEGKITAGWKTSFNRSDNNAGWEFLDGTNWKTDVLRTNHFIYQENIHAGYISLNKRIKKWSMETGIRAEYTFTEGHSRTLNQKNSHRYFKLFPSAAVQYQLSDEQQFGLSYRRKINRFGFDVMNPFTTYVSQYSYIQGNPAIRPSFSDNFGLSHTYKNKLVSSLEYSRISDVLAPVFKKEPGSEVVISTQDNLRRAGQLSLSLSYMEQLWKGKWSMTHTIGAIYAGINDPEGLDKKTTTTGAYFNVTNLLAFKKGWTAEISGNYFSALTIGVMHFRPQGSLNIGLSKSVLKNNGRLTFNITDLLNVQEYHYTVSSFGVNSVASVKPETSAARLTFTWKFGNKNVKAAKTRRTGIEEEKQRTGSN